MTEDSDRIQLKPLAESFQVLYFGANADLFGLNSFGGPPTSPLVVVDETERVG